MTNNARDCTCIIANHIFNLTLRPTLIRIKLEGIPIKRKMFILNRWAP